MRRSPGWAGCSRPLRAHPCPDTRRCAVHRYEALKFIPCFDQPDLKAHLSLSVAAPAHWTVVGNEIGTAADAVGEGDAARRLWTFKRTPLLSTYLFAVVAGPYICKRDTYKGECGPDVLRLPWCQGLLTPHHAMRCGGGVLVAAGKVPLGIFARKSFKEVLDEHWEELITITKQGLEFYGEFFGVGASSGAVVVLLPRRCPPSRPVRDHALRECPCALAEYPFSKYDQLFVPEFNHGAMENAGAVTFTEHYLFRDHVVDAQRTCSPTPG